MTPVILLFPVISFVGFTLSMGDATGEKFFAELKQLRDSETANEAWSAELYYRYIHGFFYTMLYLIPVFWITSLESYFMNKETAKTAYIDTGFMTNKELSP